MDKQKLKEKIKDGLVLGLVYGLVGGLMITSTTQIIALFQSSPEFSMVSLVVSAIVVSAILIIIIELAGWIMVVKLSGDNHE